MEIKLAESCFFASCKLLFSSCKFKKITLRVKSCIYKLKIWKLNLIYDLTIGFNDLTIVFYDLNFQNDKFTNWKFKMIIFTSCEVGF